jgi:hypothetical protein
MHPSLVITEVRSPQPVLLGGTFEALISAPGPLDSKQKKTVVLSPVSGSLDGSPVTGSIVFDVVVGDQVEPFSLCENPAPSLDFPLVLVAVDKLSPEVGSPTPLACILPFGEVDSGVVVSSTDVGVSLGAPRVSGMRLLLEFDGNFLTFPLQSSQVGSIACASRDQF